MKRPWIYLLFVVFSVSGIAYSQQRSAAADQVPPMRRIYVEDQRDRGVLLTDTGKPAEPSDHIEEPPRLDAVLVERRDAERRKRVREMLARDEDYLLAHVLAVEAVIKGDHFS